MVTTYRSMLNNYPLDWLALVWAVFASAVVLLIGAYVFMRRERSMVDVL